MEGPVRFSTAQYEEHELFHLHWEMAHRLLYSSGKERDYEVNLERHAAFWPGINSCQTLSDHMQ
jgi:hypothetical protein